MISRLPLPFVLVLLAFPSLAAAERVPVDSDRWTFRADEHRVEEHLGRQSLYLRGGLAFVEGSDLKDGVIEFDISFPEARTFVGAIWRMQDKNNYEEFYLRPHQSGNPDANQYTPIFHGAAGWQLYHGDGFSAPTRYVFDEWMHVKIAVSGGRAEVYVIDMETPAVFIPVLKRLPASGAVGLMAGSQGPAWFADFRFEPGPVTLAGSGEPPAAAENGTVMTWMVSEAFDAARLGGRDRLEEGLREELDWTELRSEPTGLANLARVQGIGQERNAVFARVTLISGSEQVKRLSFGFSDAVRVYLNGRALFAGNDVYRSRDYRYLGTIGYHDAVYLPLRKGRNELWFVVLENFGGWGLAARLEDPSGVRFGP